MTLPKGFDLALIGRSNWRTVAEWQKLGVTRADGGKFGSAKAEAFVMVPQGVNGPRFLVTKNFLAIMDYNLSHSYALAVGHLADRIRGQGAVQGGLARCRFRPELRAAGGTAEAPQRHGLRDRRQRRPLRRAHL